MQELAITLLRVTREPLYRRIFKNIDFVYAQSQLDKERLEILGAKNVEILGNIKLFSNLKIENRYKKEKTTIITAASTHESEEELIFNSWLVTKVGKLVVVPRHPERFKKVYDFLKNATKRNSLTFHSFSEKKDFSSDVILVDAMGELNEIYAISDLVILGGAFKEKIGGHNFVEPATFGCKLITGPHFFNQKAIFPFIKNIEVASSQEEIVELLENFDNLKKTSLVNKPDIELIKWKLSEAILPQT